MEHTKSKIKKKKKRRKHLCYKATLGTSYGFKVVFKQIFDGDKLPLGTYVEEGTSLDSMCSVLEEMAVAGEGEVVLEEGRCMPQTLSVSLVPGLITTRF